MNISEMLKRGEVQDRIRIGEIVEAHYSNTELKQIIDYLVEDKVMEELVLNNKGANSPNSDRILGRIEMGKLLIVELKNFVEDKVLLRQPVNNKQDNTQSPIANEPDVPNQLQMGGQV